MQKQKLIKVLKKQAIILGIWALGAIAGASAINWYYLIPTLENQTVFEQRGCVACDTTAEDMPEMAESKRSDGQVAEIPKAQEESTRLETDSHSVNLIKKVAEEEGIDWKLLYAICKVESNCTPETIGDHGDSWGAFQINKPAHPTLTQKEAFDIEWSAKWTANHGKAYKDNPNLFFKNHNGIGKTTNDWYVERCNKIYASL